MGRHMIMWAGICTLHVPTASHLCAWQHPVVLARVYLFRHHIIVTCALHFIIIGMCLSTGWRRFYANFFIGFVILACAIDACFPVLYAVRMKLTISIGSFVFTGHFTFPPWQFPRHRLHAPPNRHSCHIGRSHWLFGRCSPGTS